MTQEVIRNIKQREEVEDAEPIDCISAVAQRCLDDNSEITWKIIVMSLLDAKECILTKQILTKIECSCVGRKSQFYIVCSAKFIIVFKIGTKVDATVTVETTLRRHFSSLFYATQDCLESVTVEFFSKGLISRDVRRSPSFYKIENEFVASSSCEEDMTKLEKNCRNFIHCLAKASGPAKDAAIALAEDWEREVLNKHNLNWSLVVDIETSTDLSIPSKILLSSEVPQKVHDLREKFITVMEHIRTYYDDCKQYKIKDFTRYLTDDYEEPLTKDPLTDCGSFDILLHSVKPHYSFFNFDLIEDLTKKFPPGDELQLELDQYMQELEQFKKSTALQQMKDAIKQVPLPHEASEAHCKIVIKLTGGWRKKTVKSLENLIQYLFERDSKRAKLIEIDDGSIVVTFVTLSTAQSLIDKVQNKIQFIQYLGIFEIIINDDIVIEREENFDFSFENSLLHAINYIDSHAEHEKVALLLIKLKIKLNYQNTNGQTALMLASGGGHIEILKSLLQNGARPFVQLPANKGFVGLNHLACIALSQHIYKSTGGERIIPRADTSVEDMLEMAIKKKGVSIYKFLYSPFIHIVKNYLKRRFQWLQNCFHALNSSFHDAATNILTSKALVTEAKQHFQSYIKEDVTCENAHQLVQLLQPHYSCLNINLLTIPCTITEPIKEQVEEYNTNLKIFKDTTSLLELGMMTKGMQYLDGVGCSKLILTLNKPWYSRTITEFNKMGNFYLLPISSYLTLQVIHSDASSLTCTYLLPQLQTQSLLEAVIEQRVSLHKLGVFEVFVNDISVIMEDRDKSFTFMATLQEAYQTNNEDVLFFLLELNISLPPDTDFIIASGNGEFFTVQFLLSKDPDINIPNNDGVTALMLACINGHHQVVELLLSKNPDINIQNNDGLTALMAASCNEHHQVVQLLLNKGSDINIQSNDGSTSLMLASRNGYYQIVELLLSKDPDINIQNNDGWTALIDASLNGHHQVVELLLSKNPNINIQKNDGVTALMAASCNEHHQVVQLLLNKGSDINIQSNDGSTSLIFASRNGHHQIVELLLSKDPDINIQKYDRWTALMYASLNGHHQIVELLLSKGPNINIQTDKGATALICAITNGHYQVAQLLLSKDPDINIQSNGGFTALILASAIGHYQIVELLLSKDPDINIQDNNGWTALITASHHGHYQVVELLLSKNPDINILCNVGETALMYASTNGHYQVVELLLSKDPDINIQDFNNGITSLMLASSFGHYQVVGLLLSKNPDINIQDNNGLTSIMYASRFGHHQIVELLLTKDPDINIQSNDGWTALIIASINGYHQVVEKLLSKDLDIDIQDFNDEWTALMFASHYGHHQVVELLLSKNPDINIQNIKGETALMIASRDGHHQVVELLLSKDPDINIQTYKGFTALMFAILLRNKQIVELLLSKDPDINIQSDCGITALMFAVFYGHHQTVELLLSKDPDINIQFFDGISAFTIALILSSASLDDVHVDVLGIQFNFGNDYGRILELFLNFHPNHIHTFDGKKLHSLAVAALCSNNIHVVTVLMEKCDITPEHIISAFIAACHGGQSSMMIHFSEKITTLSNNERKLLLAAAGGDLGTLITMIYEVGMSPDTPLVAGITPLMIAAACGHIELVDTLIQAKADVNKRNDEGTNALDIVSDIGHYDRSDIKELLITNIPTGESDPVSSNANSTDPVSNIAETNKKPSTFNAIMSILSTFSSYMKEQYNPYYSKQKELNIPTGVLPYSAMT